MNERDRTDPFHFLFAGQLIPRKDPLLLIEAFSRLPRDAARLTLIGTGLLADEIRKRAQGLNIDLPGQLPMEATRAAMAQADRLILPSRHDGWGAVVSEALISGTPVICSDRCGSAGVAQASGYGRIFPAGDPAALTTAMETAIAAGKPHPDTRAALASWAQCLTAGTGAAHLDRILTSRSSHALRPPWQSAAPKIRATA
ncbi:glycosyltransferase family 4 protein [Amaricoccus tamworthensis]|uniref:glycosyltransferase family 4 protein n=1 Tax=Amaricoccus tamworthensis TaxID=57002 RepID=UPI003C7BAEC7